MDAKHEKIARNNQDFLFVSSYSGPKLLDANETKILVVPKDFFMFSIQVN